MQRWLGQAVTRTSDDRTIAYIDSELEGIVISLSESLKLILAWYIAAASVAGIQVTMIP